MPPLPGLSPVCGKSIVARFDGGCLSSDAGVLVLREIEQRLGVAERVAGCIDDPRAQAQVIHGLAEMIRFRMLMIASDYEDGNDATAMRSDPAFKLAQDVLPSGPDLASQPTLSRLENWPDRRALLRMGKALIDLYCASYARVPKRIVLDLDDTFDAVHGGQQLRLFNAHYDEYGFQPIVVFDGDGRFVTAMLRPAKRPGGVEIRKFLRRLIREIRANWPATHILIRADSHYCCPEVIDFCRANGLDFILGVAPTTTLRRRVETLEASAKARFEAGPKKVKVRRFKEFYDGAASWSRVERIVARVEAGEEGADARFVVTNLEGALPGHLLPAWLRGKSHQILEDPSCRRPHVLQQSCRQSVPPIPACWGLLAALGVARRYAKTLGLAGHAVRHAAPSAGQDRGPRGRDENPGPPASAVGVPLPGYPANRPRPSAASPCLNPGRGAARP